MSSAPKRNGNDDPPHGESGEMPRVGSTTAPWESTPPTSEREPIASSADSPSTSDVLESRRGVDDHRRFLRLAATLPRSALDQEIAAKLCVGVADLLDDELAIVLPARASTDRPGSVAPIDAGSKAWAIVTASHTTIRAAERTRPAPFDRDQRATTLDAPFNDVSLHLRASPMALARASFVERDAWFDQAALVLASALHAARIDNERRTEAERMHALQARIVQSEKMASVGQLAAQVVHELNNPLTAIVSYSDFLLRKLEREEHDAADVDRLRRIGEAADRILHFVRDLTTFARPNDEGQGPLDLGQVVERAAQFCEHLVDSLHIRVTITVDPATPIVRGARGALTQVFVNLVTNAAHAIEDAPNARDAEGRIDIHVGPDETDGVRVVVGDNGNGISPENVVRVFDPFFTTKADGRGTGLGLSIVRSIVDAHGGRVWVRSIVGQGSQFIVELAGRAKSIAP